MVQAHRTPGTAFELTVHRPRQAHEVLARGWIPEEEIRRQQRPLQLIAWLARRDEVARQTAAAAAQRNHVIQGGVLDSESGPAIDTSASTIPKGLALDLTLVLLVKHAASVAG